MAGLSDTPELMKILKGLQDSVRKQNHLLETLIASQEASSETLLPSKNALPTSLPAGNDRPEPESNETNILHRLAAKYRPLLAKRIAFYHEKRHSLATDKYFNLDENFTDQIFTDENFEKAIKELQAQPPRSWERIISEDWNYWIPIVELLSFHRPRSSLFFLSKSGAGRPNYVPRWELRRIGNEYVHVDDLEKKEPILIPEHEVRVETEVPYSFRPPLEAPIATTGITVNWNELHEKLGDLYATPPDDRISLHFERNELRLKCASESISPYLTQVHDVFQRLDQTGGSFRVHDIDSFGGSAVYSWGSRRDATLETMPCCWRAAGPAMLGEYQSLQIAPKTYEYLEFKGDSQVALNQLNICNWYRLIHFRGLSSIIGSKDSDTEKIWRLLINTERGHTYFYNSILREALDLHISCNRLGRQGSINPFSDTFKPFHITWFNVLSEKGKDFDGSSWESGPLYGSKTGQWIHESAFTFAYFPRNQLHPGLDLDSDDVEENGYDFWTILLLTSSGMRSYAKADFWEEDEEGPATYVLRLIFEGLKNAADSWGAVGDHFKTILDNENTITAPQKHDELLFDDDAFSRSRRYF